MFYAVAAENGFGVYTNWDDVQESRKYLKKFYVKKYKSLEYAFSDAKNTYNDMNVAADEEALFISLCNDITLNRIYYRNKIREMNKLGGGCHVHYTG